MQHAKRQIFKEQVSYTYEIVKENRIGATHRRCHRRLFKVDCKQMWVTFTAPKLHDTKKTYNALSISYAINVQLKRIWIAICCFCSLTMMVIIIIKLVPHICNPFSFHFFYSSNKNKLQSFAKQVQVLSYSLRLLVSTGAFRCAK